LAICYIGAVDALAAPMLCISFALVAELVDALP
jgi:hypothetical protein